MRFFSLITAILVSVSLYLVVFEREALLTFATGEAPGDAGEETAAEETQNRVPVVALASSASEIEQIVLVRGQTEAARQVDVRAETNGQIVSEPLRKGTYVEAGDLLCRIDPGTRGISLEDAMARLAEAKSNVPEAEARLVEAMAAVPAAEARIAEAEANVPAAIARLAEAMAGVPAAEARLAEAMTRVPEARAKLAEAMGRVPETEARLSEAMSRVPEARAKLAEAEARVPEAEARLAEAETRLPEAEARLVAAQAGVNEADINLNAATKLSRGGFASGTRVASTQAAAGSANAQVQSTLSQIEGAKAGIQAAKSQIEAARAGVQSARTLLENAYAGIQTAKSQVENAATGIQTAKSAVESANAGIQTAKSAVENANAGIETAKSAVESAKAGVISARSQLQGALAGVESARSGVESARAGIQSAEVGVAGARKEIERLAVHAPFAGLLETDTAELGSLLQPGGLCATVIQLDPIKLVGFVPETEVDNVKVGAAAGSRLATGRKVVGKVTFLSRSADPDTRTFRVEVQVPNKDLSIRDGQTAEILIKAAGQSAHLIPQSALTLDDDGKLGVRIVDATRHAEFVAVTVLRDTVDGMFVSGLPEQADIVVVGQEFVTDGVPVKPTFRKAVQ